MNNLQVFVRCYDKVSTGPKTRAGIADSKTNAMKHGLLAEDFVVRGEDPVEFAVVLQNLVDELQPQGPLEEQLVERVAACMWRLRRLYRVEAEIFTHAILAIELNDASEEVARYEVSFGDLAFEELCPVHVRDEERHARATARLGKAQRFA